MNKSCRNIPIEKRHDSPISLLCGRSGTHTSREGLIRYPLEAKWAPSLSYGLCPLSLPREKCGNDTGSQCLLRSVWSIWQPQAGIHEPTSRDGGTHSAGAPPTDKPRLSAGTGSPDGAVRRWLSPQQDVGEWIIEVCCAVCEEEVRGEQGPSCWKQQLLPTGVGNKTRGEEPAVHLETASSLGADIFYAAFPHPSAKQTKQPLIHRAADSWDSQINTHFTQ